MDTINIDTYIIISPKEIGYDLNKLIEKKLQDMYVHKCIKKYGYIFEILDYKFDDRIMTSRVNEFMYLKCQVTMLTITPTVGNVYYGTVRIVYPQGIFVSLVNIFDTLVPHDCLKKAGYTFTGGAFTNGKNTIIQSSVLNVKVTAINYDKKNFNCIADLVTADQLKDPVVEIDDVLAEAVDVVEAV
jgi:DNA-directed RNA polymerase subunit E'/Rpb7